MRHAHATRFLFPVVFGSGLGIGSAYIYPIDGWDDAPLLPTRCYPLRGGLHKITSVTRCFLPRQPQQAGSYGSSRPPPGLMRRRRVFRVRRK